MVHRWRFAGLLPVVAVFSLSAASASADVPDPDSRYNTPGLERDDRGLVVTADPAPSGAQWTLALDPARTYRVVVEGTVLSGPFTMRSRADTAGPVWQWAPEGTIVRRVSGVSALELLLYSDASGAAYRLERLEVEDCTATCKSDADLRAEVLAANPAIADALAAGRERQAAELILGWAAERIPFSRGGTGTVDTSQMTASEIYYENFAPTSGGVFCGGAADFFAKLLRLFGLDAFAVDFGSLSEGFTHVTVILREFPPNKATPRYHVVDPTFGLSFSVLRSGRSMTLNELIYAWQADELGPISPDVARLESRELLTRGADGTYSVESCGDPSVTSTACSLAEFLPSAEPYFLAAGYEPGVPGFIEFLLTEDLLAPAAVPDHYEIWREARLAVTETVELPLSNDDLRDAPLLRTTHSAITATNVTATLEPNETARPGPPGGASVWYRWAAPGSGQVSVDLCDSEFDTLLSVYEARGGEAPRVVGVNDDGCASGLGSRMEFDTKGCETYLVAVDGYYADTGSFGLRIAGPEDYGRSRCTSLTAPDTVIVSRSARRHGRLVSFRFGSSIGSEARFVCSLDDGPVEPCNSLHRVLVRRGRHRFSVHATTYDGTPDPTPAVARWRAGRRG